MNSLKLVLGRYDDPENQIQKDYWMDLYSSNLAIFGTSMSGKTTLLKTLLIRIHQMGRNDIQEEIYILDFSNNLEKYQKLPFVVAYFDAFSEENVRRIFKIIEQKMSYNIKALPGKTYVQCDESIRPPHITFVLDGLSAFMSEDKYANYHEVLAKIARDGLAKGVSVVFAANEPTGGIGRILSSFNRVVAFDLPKDKYADIFQMRVDKPMVLQGRGIANIETIAYEFQAYFPYNLNVAVGTEDRTEDNAIGQICDNLKRLGVDVEALEKEKLKSFSADITSDTWKQYTLKPYYIPGYLNAGLDYYSMEPIMIDLQNAQSIAIYGRKEFGKSNLLRLILEGAKEIPNVHFVFWDDGRRGLESEVVKDVIDSLQSKTFFESRDEFEKYLTDRGYIESYSDTEFEDSRPKYSNAEEDDDDEKPEGFPQNVYYEEEEEVIESYERPFTVFVIQSRLYYQNVGSIDEYQLIYKLAPLISNSVGERVLFIFSDVQKIVSHEIRTYFNNSVAHAFLLDDIVRFVNDKGKQSVFADQDVADLKERFGRCDLGDGFYFNIERDDLTKLKFIKAI